MTEEELERIEEAYETRIGPDATTVRALLKEIRRLQQLERDTWSEQS